MKNTLALVALLAATHTAHAQLFRPETASGAVLGGIAGAVIGNNSGDLGHDAWKGAAIGTVAGALIGSAVGEARDRSHIHEVPVPVHADHAYRSGYRRDAGHGYGYAYGHRSGGHGGHGAHGGYYSPSHTYHPSYGASHYHRHADVYYADASSGTEYRQSGYYDSAHERTSGRATAGLFLGGLAGAIIGHNSGDLRHNAWRGAAIGAGSGWLLGSLADHRARQREREREADRSGVLYYESARAPESTAATAIPPTVIINNNYYGTPSPMSSANSLFGR